MRLLAIVVLILSAACSVARPPDDATGEEIYALLCANCHGADLEGGLAPALGPGSNSAARPDEFLEVSIVHGRGRMPSFSSSLSQEQVRLVIDFIRERQEG
ncbi:MAG: cytochrome c [Acidimicrobiia bacterium]|nr:cytochrome c [Acidimicrobiia bacterium]